MGFKCKYHVNTMDSLVVWLKNFSFKLPVLHGFPSIIYFLNVVEYFLESAFLHNKKAAKLFCLHMCLVSFVVCVNM